MKTQGKEFRMYLGKPLHKGTKEFLFKNFTVSYLEYGRFG